MIKAKIHDYIPKNNQEKKDKETILLALNHFDDCLTRNNTICHFSASSWIVNQDNTKVLMIYHKLYNSWAWTGGHVDGNQDFLDVAIKEAKEETGLESIKVLSNDIFSIEVLPVNSHIKNNQFVSSHLHLNVTYLLQAHDSDTLKVNVEETSGVQWIPVDSLQDYVSEKNMLSIYEKLISLV